MKQIPVLMLAALFISPAAENNSGFVHWSAAELKGYQQKLAPKINAQKVATQSLSDFGNHTVAIGHREGDGEAEVHELMSDVFVVQSGEATLVYGGQVVNEKTTAPHELRGSSIKGGQKTKLGPGDVVHIPVKMPHQLLIENGKQFTYLFVKVRSDK